MKWIIDPTPNGALTAHYRVSECRRFYLSKHPTKPIYTLADGDRLVCSGTKAECIAAAIAAAGSQPASSEIAKTGRIADAA